MIRNSQWTFFVGVAVACSGSLPAQITSNMAGRHASASHFVLADATTLATIERHDGGGTKPEPGFDTLIVVGLSPLGSVEEDFFFGLYFSSRLARDGVSIEPGFPAGWATSLSLRLIEGADRVFELHDPTGLIHRFTARRSADQWVADDLLVLDLGPDSGCGGQVLDPEGYVWVFDADRFVREVHLPDRTRLRITRDPTSHHILRIEAEPLRAWQPVRRAADIKIQYWKWPLFARWLRPEPNRLWLAAGQSLPRSSLLSNVPAATSLEIMWEGPFQWTITDDTGRYWSTQPLDGGDQLVVGTALSSDLDVLGTAAWVGNQQRVFGLPAWIFFERCEQIRQADERDPGPDSPARGASPLHPVIPGPFQVCPEGWEQCGSTLYPISGCAGCYPGSPFSWQWGPYEYQGTLTWQGRWAFLLGLTCTPGNGDQGQVRYSYSLKVALDAGLGLEGIGNWRVGIEQTQTVEGTRTWSLACCQWYDADGRLRSSCTRRIFQAIIPHTLYYRSRPRSGGEWAAWMRTEGVWLSQQFGDLLCCDKCCAVR